MAEPPQSSRTTPGLEAPYQPRTADDHEARIHNLELDRFRVFDESLGFLRFGLAGVVVDFTTAPQFADVPGIITRLDAAVRIGSSSLTADVRFRMRKNGNVVGPIFTIPIGATRFSGTPGSLAGITLNDEFDVMTMESMNVTDALDLMVRVGTESLGSGERT